MTSTATSAAPVTPGLVFLPVTADDSPFRWPNPGLGTTLNGPLLSKRIASAVTALRAELAKAGFSMGEALVYPAKRDIHSTSKAFREARAGVCDVSVGAGAAIFGISVVIGAEVEPGEPSPNFDKMRAQVLTGEGSVLLISEPLESYDVMDSWAGKFRDDLLAAMAP